jgi:hypothetical protein
MKKILLFVAALVWWFCIIPSFASAGCQDVRFSDGSRFCFDIKKINSSTFEAQISSNTTSSALSCALTLPNNRVVWLSNCEWRFTYDWNDVWMVHLRATARTTYDFIANYDFRNWSFDSYNSSYSNDNYDYYPEFTYTSTTRPNTDNWIDVTLKVKRSGYSSYSYNWYVDFYVERYYWGSWSRASSYQYDLNKSSYSFYSSDYWEVRLNSLVRFRESWEYRLVAELRSNGSKTYQTFNVDGYNNNGSSSSYNARELSVYSISPSSPWTYEWIDVTLRAITSDWSVASNYNKKVRIEVQQYRNGLWQTADYSDYDLDKDYYSFSTSDNGRKTFNSLVRFRRSWEYRIKFTEEYDSSVYGTRTINVGWSSSSYDYNSSYYAKELQVYSVSSSNPSTYQWINVTLKAIASNGSVAGNYNKRVRIEVQQYYNWSWRSANSYDYELDKTSYTFSTSDNGTKTFYSLVRFKTNWEFRLKFTEDNDSSVYGTRTINVGWYYSSNSNSSYYYNSYYSDYGYDNFTDLQLKKLRAVYDIWDNVISALEKDYPRLKNDSWWRSRSDTFQRNMKDVLTNNRSSNFRNWNDFYNWFMDWLSYTTRYRD